jgi:regulator of sigma E protease
MSLEIIIEFAIGIVLLIFLHEFGHFLACKMLGIGVEEFGFGFPPRIAVLFERGGTKFTINALPLGGFVRPKGEMDPEIKDGLAGAHPFKRILVMLAGPTMNILTAAILFFGIFAIIGTMPDRNRVLVGEVQPGSPASAAGLQAGDILVSIDGTNYHSPDTIHNEIYSNLGDPLVFVYERNGVPHSVIITPVKNPTPTGGAVGVGLTYAEKPFNFFGAIPESFMSLRDYASTLFTTIGQVIGGQANSADTRLTGFKGMYDMYAYVRQAPSAPGIPKVANVMSFFAIISFSLGFMNLLPIPPLDGGKIVFALPELVVHRRIPVKYEVWVSSIAFLILIILMLYINAQDFIHPIPLPTLPPPTP